MMVVVDNMEADPGATHSTTLPLFLSVLFIIRRIVVVLFKLTEDCSKNPLLFNSIALNPKRLVLLIYS